MSKKTLALSAGRPSARSKPAFNMADQEPMVRLNVVLPESAHTKLKVHASRRKVTISELIRNYIDTLPE